MAVQIFLTQENETRSPLTCLGTIFANLLRDKTASTITWGSRMPQTLPNPGRSITIFFKLEGCAALANALMESLIVSESLSTSALSRMSCNSCRRFK